MSEHEINVKVNLDDNEAQKKLNDLTNKERKININVDTSDIDQASKKADNLKNKDVKLNVKTIGKETIDDTTKSLDKATKSASSFGNTVKGFAKFGGYLEVFQAIKQGAQEAVQAIKEIDDAIVDLQIASGESYENVRQMVTGWNSMAKSLGSSTVEVLKASDTWLRQGKSVSEANELIQQSMVLSKLGQIDSDDASTYLTAMINGFHVATDEVSSLNDAISAIDMSSAVDAAGLAEATSRVAASADLAGVSLERLLGYEAAIGEASQESMSVIGNSLKTIFQRLGSIKAGNLELIDEDGTVTTLSDVETVFKNIGIPLRDSINEFRDYGDILDDLAAKWSNLSSVQQSAVSQVAAGTFQANRFKLLMENYDKALEYEQIALGADGTAAAKFEDAYLNSIEAKTKSLQAAFEGLSTNLISRDSINGVLEATQALVEFLDKTNLVKGALAGIVAGGVVKGFTMLTSSITQSVMQMNNFSKALKLIKAGNIGEDAIQHLSVLTYGLSKSQLKAVISSEALSTAQRMQILQNAGLSEAQAAATLSTMGLSTAQGTATATTVTLSGTLKGLWATLMANPLIAIVAGVTAVVAVMGAYNRAVEESIQRAKDITSSWEESNNSLSEQIAKYQELKSQLDSGTLAPDEEYSTRQQILDIQSQITSQYGEQAQGISLVNGNLQEQLALLQNIAAENAKTTLNKSRDDYNNVAKQMERARTYQLGSAAFTNKNKIEKDILNIAKDFEDAGLTIKDTGEGVGTYNFTFEGDASQADETITAFMNRVSDLQEKYQGNEFATNRINSTIDYASDALKKNQEILDDYQESYDKFLQMDMLSRGTDEGSLADTYNKYAEAISNYNEALVSDDNDAINKARADFQSIDQEVNNLLSKGDNSKFASIFENVENTLDDASIKLHDFNEAHAGQAGESNTFGKTADDIKEASDGLKELKLDAQDVREALITDGDQTGEKQILALAEAWGLTKESIEGQDEAFQKFLNILSEAGLITGQVASATDAATASYEAFSTSVQTASDNLTTLQDIISESSSGSGISADNVKAFQDMFGSDSEKVLKKTANGYHLNVDALRELQAQQETLTKSDYLSALSDQYELLADNAEKLAKAQFMGDTDQISTLEATRQGILSQISSLQDLQYHYESATSAYQDWINAQSNGSERDMYENIQSGYSQVKDLIDRGWGGSDEVRTYVDLLSSADLSTASVDEVIDAYNRLGQTIGNSGHSILDFFTVDEDGNITTDGIYNFFDTVNSVLGEEFAKINENGDYEFNFGEGRDQTVADILGMDVEGVQSILRAATDAGFETNLDQPIASLEELKTSAQSAQEALSKMEDTSLGDINFDSTSFAEITDDIAQVEEYIDQLKNDKTLEPDVKTEKLENANAILEYLVEMQNEAGSNNIEITVNAEELEQKISDAKSALDAFKNDSGVVDLSVEGAQEAIDNLQALLYSKEQLNAPIVMAIDTSQVDGDLGAAIGKIQEFQQALSDLNVVQGLADAGVDIDTSAAQQKVQDLAGQIQNLDGNTKASLGLDTSEFDTALSTIQNQKVDVQAGVNLDQASLSTISSSISAISPEVLVKAGVDPAAVDAYDPADKDAEVKYTVNAAKVNAYDPPDKDATVIYSPDTSGLPTIFSSITRTVKYKATGDVGVNGTAHAEGTANASGNWGIIKGGTSLVGELGQEILVRDSKFYTIGDNGAEFIKTKPGDIIFNHKQSESLLKNGYVTSRGKMVGGNANANGTAYSSGSGGLGRPSRPSSGMGSSNTSNNSSTNKATQSVNKAANNLSSVAKETSEAAEKLSDTLSGYTDWVKRVFEAREREIDHLTSQMERIAHLTDKQIKTYEILSKNREYINNTQTAKQTYQSHLDMLQSQMNLNPTIIKQIQTGSFDISKYDDETQKLISEYQEYYDKLQDCSAQYDDLLAQQDELAQAALDNVSNYYDMFNQVDQAMQGWLEAQRDLWENQGLSATADSQYASIQSSLEQERKVAERLEQKISSYTDEINKLISNGYMDRHSEAYYEAQEALNGFKQELYESQSAIIEFEDQLRELDYTALQNKIDGFARAVDKISAQINLMEARDEKVPESVYQQQIDANNSQIEANMQLRDSKLKEQGLYDVGSTRYQELAEEINELDVATLNLRADNEALKDSIYELRFDRLDNQLKVYDDLKTEIDDFRSLLNEDAFFDKNGVVTEEGLAELALLQQGIIASKREVADYREGLEKLKESYVNGVISLDEYNEKSEEYCAGIRESIKDVSDYEDALTDLYMTQMRTESEALQEVIDKRKEALQAKSDYYNYDRTISSKQKDINMLRAEIQALTGVNNAAAQARLKQLQSDLEEAQSDLDDTKYQHSIDMQQQGYDSMSDQLNQILEYTEYEITHNAEKQQEVVQSMLNNVVNMYESAYGKINSIIENTGWAGSYAFRQNQTQLSTSTGAQTQTNNATQSQSNVKPSDAANSTITNPIDNNESYNNKVEQEITQAPNTENRLVAELKLSPTSVSLEEGKSTKITATMRPNDAKNKTLSWKSSNTSIATVSGGTIKAIKAGSCQITASTTDGSGLSVTVGVTVTAKPKPVQPEKKPSTPSTGGDGVPNIGDAVTYTSGRYYYSSDGLKPSGNQYLGKTVYIGHINNADWATKPYALYADKDFKHPLGWVSLDQISGYAKGTKSVPFEQIAEVNEEGRELIVTSDGRVLRRLQPGDGVIPNNITENLLKMGENPAKFVQDAITQVQTPVVNKISSGDMNVTNHYDSLLTVNGNVDKEALPELKEILKKSYDYTVQNIAKDAAKMGFKKRF